MRRPEARGLKSKRSEPSTLRFDLHLARGAGRIAGRDREASAPGDQAQDMPHAGRRQRSAGLPGD